ncbi:MAG: A/G-specific adenine glycosylase [Anaeroplasmataceae bacterium]|nr:A/G-specific adenine glycosylase [Anaeroplasmataceae bacterium]
MKEIVFPLLEWFNQNKRDLEWRKNTSAYAILVSEIMLQQTRVEAVKPYYQRFMQELPDFKALANCSDTLLMKLWEGLGYYSRARNLKKCAIEIVDKYNQTFPKNYSDAIKLPGVGSYTCGAVLSRAYNQKYAAVDGNVLRVLTRYLCCDKDIMKESTKQYFKGEIEKIIPNQSGLFNESLMELGATICMPKITKCNQCPIHKTCKAFQMGTQFSYPVKQKKKAQKILEYTCLFITDGKTYILLPKKDNVLKDMPSPFLIDRFITSNDALDYIEELGFSGKNILSLKEHKHVFTHQIWYMKSYLVYVNSINDFPSYSPKQIQMELSVPTCFKKIMDDFL